MRAALWVWPGGGVTCDKECVAVREVGMANVRYEGGLLQ